MASIKTERQIIFPKGNAPPIAPYSPGVRLGNTLYISGQVGMDPNTKALVPGGIAAETEQALKNMGNILSAAGIGFDNVVKCTVLLADMNEFSAMNEVYQKHFTPGKYPARAAYQVACLPLNCRVEIEAIAAVGELIDA